MLTINNTTDINLDIALLEKMTAELTQKEVELFLINTDEMRDANKEYRDKDETTDVLSFPLEDIPYAPLGSILINIDMAKDISKEMSHTLEDEVAILFLHGMLHLLGYDHECDSGEQAKEEERLRERFALPNNLIKRVVS